MENTQEMPKADRELIKEYREYNEDKDQGGHRFASLTVKLSRRVGSSDSAKIERWVVEQERKYGLVPKTYETRADTSLMNDIQLQEYSESQIHLKQMAAETTDPKAKAFYERLFRMSSLEEDRIRIQ